MSNPYVGEIRMFAGNFNPAGWMLCQGQLLAISEYDTLFNLIGTTYGGDGQNTFALPDLSSRVPIHQGQGAGLSTYVIGQKGGVENVTLTGQQMPVHTHVPQCNTGAGSVATPAGSFWAANSNTALPQFSATSDSTMNPAAVSNTGGSQPHENLMPYLTINFIISLFGIYPSQN